MIGWKWNPESQFLHRLARLPDGDLALGRLDRAQAWMMRRDGASTSRARTRW